MGWGKGERTLQATYYFACNLLLAVPPAAFLKNSNKVQRNPARLRFCIWRATSFKCERAGREGGRGRLNLAGGASCRRRLADSGKRVGAGRARGRVRSALQLLSRCASAAAADGAARRGGGGGPAGARRPPARVRTRRPPLPSLAPPRLPRGRVGPSGPESRWSAAAPFPCNPVAPCEVTHFAQLGPGRRGVAAPLPCAARCPRRGTGRAPLRAGGRRAGAGRGGEGRYYRNSVSLPGRPGSRGGGRGRPRDPGAAGRVEGQRWDADAVGAGGGGAAVAAPAVAERRQQVAPLSAAARALGRERPGRGASARVCDCVRAEAPPRPRPGPARPPRPAAPSRVRAASLPSPPAPPPFCELESVAEPESPPARRGRAVAGGGRRRRSGRSDGAPAPRTRAREPRRAGTGAARGPPRRPGHGRLPRTGALPSPRGKGAAVYFLFLEKNLSLLPLPNTRQVVYLGGGGRGAGRR